MKTKKCDFEKMGYRYHPKPKKDIKKTKKILADQKKRKKEWTDWLGGYNG